MADTIFTPAELNDGFVVAIEIDAKVGTEDAVGAALGASIEPTMAEPGVKLFLPYRSPRDPKAFFIFELYRSEAGWAQHQQTDHFKALVDSMLPPASRGGSVSHSSPSFQTRNESTFPSLHRVPGNRCGSLRASSMYSPSPLITAPVADRPARQYGASVGKGRLGLVSPSPFLSEQVVPETKALSLASCRRPHDERRCSKRPSFVRVVLKTTNRSRSNDHTGAVHGRSPPKLFLSSMS